MTDQPVGDRPTPLSHTTVVTGHGDKASGDPTTPATAPLPSTARTTPDGAPVAQLQT